MSCSNVDFPHISMLPKTEIGALSYLGKYPRYDGRGIRIAILDTGVDPLADGLQQTTTGGPKIVDIIDTTGSGDVDMSHVQKVDENSELTGLTGRKLKVPSEWKNPTGEYRLGTKSLYQLFPKQLIDRLQKDKRQKLWDPKHSRILQKVMLEASGDEAKVKCESSQEVKSKSEFEEKLKKENREAQVEMLEKFDKNWSDCGPTVDCVIFHDGSNYQACLDLSCTGDLSKATLMQSYKESYQCSSFGEEDKLTYSFNIYDEGKTLCIVSNGGSHGTHVASITAGYFPNNERQNGVAPGAEIVAVKIGDSRVATMETGSALIRAMKEVVDSGCHLANLSYGEAANWPNQGKVLDAINEAVTKHNLTFVSSAGNNGPCLTTLGAPGGTCQNVIGVGAWVSPDMMLAEYSMMEKLPANQYTWSSRGPCVDGSMGVCVSAPGGAITSVPNWTLHNSQLMNGTSMSSPNACGGIALVLSGLQQNNISWNPANIKRALMNSAAHQKDIEVFAQGSGLLQVNECFDLMCRWKDRVDNLLNYKISCGAGKHGIYLRPCDDADSPQLFNVTIDPAWHKTASNDQKIRFSMNLNLCSSQPWLTVPSYYKMVNMARSVQVKIDTRGLPEGCHHAEIIAYDTDCVEHGPVFRVPVTVVKPKVPCKENNYEFENSAESFRIGEMKRNFYKIPDRASWAELTIKNTSGELPGKFIIHAIQLEPGRAYRANEFYKFVSITKNAPFSASFPVKGGQTVELCIARWWNNTGKLDVDWKLQFRGLKPKTSPIVIHASEGINKLEMESLMREEAQPVVELKQMVQPLRPSSSKVSALGTRDNLVGGRFCYQMVNTYTFSVSKSCEAQIDFAMLSDLLYENEYMGQMWHLYNQNKQFVAAGDAYPKQYNTRMEKGEYTLKLQVKHHQKEMLTKLQHATINLLHKLNQPPTVDFYPTHRDALVGGSKLQSCYVTPDKPTMFYAAPIPDDKLPKQCQPGWMLTGNLVLPKSKTAVLAGHTQFKYVITESIIKSKKSSSKSSSKAPVVAAEPISEPAANEKGDTPVVGGEGSTVAMETDSVCTTDEVQVVKSSAQQKLDDKMADEERDMKINWIVKYQKFDLVNELKGKYPDYLPLYISTIQAIDSQKPTTRLNKQDLLIELCDDVISKINVTEMLSNLQRPKSEGKNPAEKQKQQLLTALIAKGRCYADQIMLQKPIGSSLSEKLENLTEVYKALGKIADFKDSELQSFLFWFGSATGNHGIALKAAYKVCEDKNNRENYRSVIKVCKELGWSHASDHLIESMLVKFPKHHIPF